MTLQDKVKEKVSQFYHENKKVILFILRVAIIYASWKLLSFFLGEESTKIDERIWPWLSQGWESFNSSVRLVILNLAQAWFNLVGLESEIVNNYRLWVYGYAIVGVGNYCLAIQLWLFFGALIFSYSGKWYNKLWFSIVGILLINLLNVARIVAVVYVAHVNPAYVDFNHDYVFNVIIYIFTFFMWMLWVNKFSDEKRIKNEKK